MDQAKVAFLFGQTPDWADPDNPEDRGGLLSELFDDDEEMSRARLALYETVANQVANDDPPEVWKTAQRLLGLGLERKKVLSDLVLAMVPQVIAGVAESQPYDYAAHKAALAALPLPGAEEVVVAMISVVREHQPVASDEVRRMAAEMLKIPVDQEPHKTFIECALDQAVEDEDLEFATGSLVIEPSSFFAGAVLTHRVTDDERDDGYLPIGVDLTLFEQAEFARGTGGVELEDFWSEDAGLAWRGPKGWLDPFPVGAVFAATANEDGTAISIEALAMPPPVDDAAVAALRAAYDECVEEIDLPVPIRQLALTLLTKDGHFFDEPRAPIRELIAAAGLERRDDEVAHSPEIWRRDDELRQYQRVIARFDDLDDADAALSVITLFNEGDWDDAHRMRQALSVLLEDAMGAGVVAGELLGPELEESAEIAAQAALAARFAERLLAVARKPTELAVARWLMGLADERSGDVLGAEAQLHIAVEVSGDWGPAVDRLAWYLSDKGEANEAARLWRSLGLDEDDPRLLDLGPAAVTSVERPGRNEPCWCGSGRKYKTCHLDKPVLAPLPERLPWLARKGSQLSKTPERTGGAGHSGRRRLPSRRGHERTSHRSGSLRPAHAGSGAQRRRVVREVPGRPRPIAPRRRGSSGRIVGSGRPDDLRAPERPAGCRRDREGPPHGRGNRGAGTHFQQTSLSRDAGLRPGGTRRRGAPIPWRFVQCPGGHGGCVA